MINQNRLQNVQQQLQQNNIAAMALVPGPNMLYISGMHTHLSERPIVTVSYTHLTLPTILLV